MGPSDKFDKGINLFSSAREYPFVPFDTKSAYAYRMAYASNKHLSSKKGSEAHSQYTYKVVSYWL